MIKLHFIKVGVTFIYVAEFGVFVDTYGRRSRTEDIKWSRLPLSFGKYTLERLHAAIMLTSV